MPKITKQRDGLKKNIDLQPRHRLDVAKRLKCQKRANGSYDLALIDRWLGQKLQIFFFFFVSPQFFFK